MLKQMLNLQHSIVEENSRVSDSSEIYDREKIGEFQREQFVYMYIFTVGKREFRSELLMCGVYRRKTKYDPELRISITTMILSNIISIN